MHRCLGKRKLLSCVYVLHKTGRFTLLTCNDSKEMCKNGDARTMLLCCQSKPIAFLPFSLPSPSSLLKLSNDFGNITPGRHIFCNVTNFKETLEGFYSHAELFTYRTQCINYNSVFCKQFDMDVIYSVMLLILKRLSWKRLYCIVLYCIVCHVN